MIGGNIYRSGDRNVYVAFNHFVGRPRFSEPEHGLISGYMYHLTRWMKQLVTADGLRLALAAGNASLQSLAEGFLVLDYRRRIVFANDQAKMFLGHHSRRDSYGLAGYDIGMDVGVILKFVQRTRLIEQVEIRREDGNASTRWHLTFLPVSREMNFGHGAPDGMTTLISPTATHPSTGIGTSEYEHPDVIVFIRKLADTVDHAALLRERFGLTRAEARLAEGIGRGVTLAAYASQRSISISTVRTQVRALLEKTGETNLRTLAVFLGKLGLTGSEPKKG